MGKRPWWVIWFWLLVAVEELRAVHQRPCEVVDRLAGFEVGVLRIGLYRLEFFRGGVARENHQIDAGDQRLPALGVADEVLQFAALFDLDRKSTRLNSS